MPTYIYQLPEWPAFEWDRDLISKKLSEVRHKQGRILGRMESLGFNLRIEANLETLTLDVVKSSEIEGENLDTDQVRSSIARKLGIHIGGLVPSDRHVDGIVAMMIDATENFKEQLTEKRLFAWHAVMFPTGKS